MSPDNCLTNSNHSDESNTCPVTADGLTGNPPKTTP